MQERIIEMKSFYQKAILYFKNAISLCTYHQLKIFYNKNLQFIPSVLSPRTTINPLPYQLRRCRRRHHRRRDQHHRERQDSVRL